MKIDSYGPHLVMGLGAVLLFIAAVHHIVELSVVDWIFGPLIAVAVDGLPAIILIGLGMYLLRMEFRTEAKWTIAKWSLFGAVGFTALMLTTLLIQMDEGESFREPIFILLVSANIGAIGGFVSGFFYSRAEADARRAEQATDALGFVNSIIRHDLRNDLNVIQGNAHKITNGIDEDQAAQVITRKSEEALTRIEDSRAIVQTLVGEAEREEVDLVAIVTETVDRFEATDSDTISTELPETVEVYGDLGLRSVVDNLIENAVDHNDAADSQVRIDIEENVETVRLKVRDNGPGIPDERKDSVFAPRGDGPGNGGLHLVKTLVEGYGGSIRVEDNDPRGSIFVVELPRFQGTQ